MARSQCVRNTEMTVCDPLDSGCCTASNCSFSYSHCIPHVGGGPLDAPVILQRKIALRQAIFYYFPTENLKIVPIFNGPSRTPAPTRMFVYCTTNYNLKLHCSCCRALNIAVISVWRTHSPWGLSHKLQFWLSAFVSKPAKRTK